MIRRTGFCRLFWDQGANDSARRVQKDVLGVTVNEVCQGPLRCLLADQVPSGLDGRFVLLSPSDGIRLPAIFRRALRTSKQICRTMSIPASSFVVPRRRQLGPAQTRRQTMRVMVFAKATEGMSLGEPTPEALEAFAAMDRYTEELVKAGVFVAAAGLKNDAQSKRIVSDGSSRTVTDGPFAESRELIVGFSIWEVKDMDEAMAWAKRSPTLPGEMEMRQFYEAADLAEFVTPEELSTPRDGERGKLGVA
jgi:hypothetical protein